MSEKWLKTVAKTGNYEDLKNKPEITSEVNSLSVTTLASALAVKKVNDKIEDININIKDGKTKLAEAITSKGQESSVNDTFDSMSEKIKSIETGIQTLDATASANQILSGTTAYVNNEKITGTMVNQGAKNSSLNAGHSFTIPEGYHNGTGKITANSLASQTSATANAGQILSGQTAYVNGNKITGNMPNRGNYQIAKNNYFYTHSDGVTYLVNWIPGGFYFPWQKASDGTMCGESWIRQSDLIGTLGITADKIVSGQNIAGVVGTAKPARIASGTIDTKIGQYGTFTFDIGFTPTVLIVFDSILRTGYNKAAKNPTVFVVGGGINAATHTFEKGAYDEQTTIVSIEGTTGKITNRSYTNRPPASSYHITGQWLAIAY